jgi:RNA-directed DNA polymerase
MGIGHREGVSFNEIISLGNLLLAWREFRTGKRKKKDVMAFERNLEENLFRLHWELANDHYQHGQYQSFVIHDPKRRDIHKATVRDRVIHHAVFRVLYPFFDPAFIDDSFSCRIDKGSHRAIFRLQTFLQNTSRNSSVPCYALKCDVKKFFASMDHEILLNILSARVTDQRVMRLLRIIITSFPEEHRAPERERERESKRVAAWTADRQSDFAAVCEPLSQRIGHFFEAYAENKKVRPVFG